MTPKRWQKIEHLFHAALACKPVERAEFLADQCANDEQLRLEIDSILSSHEAGQASYTSGPDDGDGALLEAYRQPISLGAQNPSEGDGGAAQISKPANAYQAYQLARYHFHKVSFPDLMKSRIWLEEAVRLDADFAPAYVALAEQSVMETITGLHSPSENFPKAKEALRRASDLNLNTAEFYSVAGFANLICDWSFTEAESNLRKALELNPHHGFANKYLGEVLMFQRRAHEAETYLQRALEIAPLSLHVGIILTISYFLARNYQKVIDESEKLLVIYPSFVVARLYRCLAWEQLGRAAEAVVEYQEVLRDADGEIARRFMGHAYALIGDRENALDTIAKLDAESRQHYLSPTHQAAVYAGLNEKDKAFSYLHKSLSEHDPWILWIATDPRLDSLRASPRFEELLNCVGLGTGGARPSRLRSSMQARNFALESQQTSTPAPQTTKRSASGMAPERWQRIDQLFHAAMAYEPARRAEFLAAECSDDESLVCEVDSLISSYEEAPSFIEAPPGDIAAEMLRAHKSTIKPGQQIENYRIVGQLGSGGMGEVYLADDMRLNRQLALKLLPPHFTVNPDRVRRFEREARAVSALNHPNIVTIYEIGQSDSTHFIATEFVDGKTLRQLINEKPFTLSGTLKVAIQVAGALSGAHAAGIVHRDIKPENIMVRADGYVKILDFGLAKLTEHQTKDSDLETPTLLQSNPGLVMGTVQYMSPEQARAKRVDARTDIWSLGVVLYELLSGRVPFSGDTPSHVMVSLMEDALPPLTDYAHVPAELDRIVTKALRKNRKERYQSASQLASDLKALKEELQLETRLKGLLEAVPPRKEQTEAATAEFKTSPVRETAALGAAHTASNAGFQASRRQTIVIVTLLFLLVLATGWTYLLMNRAKTNFAAESTHKSIAVLPLRPIDTANRDQLYEIGIADALIHKLSSMKGFVVRPLSATRKYADIDHDPLAAGKEQQADYVLVSNYQLAGGTIRVTSQLLNVATGQIEETYKTERDGLNVFAIQDAIALEVGNILLARFATTKTSREVRRGTTNEEAYRLYLQGMYLYGKRTERASKEAVELLDQAVRLDPNYALAWAGKAHAHRYAANLGRETDIHGEYRKSIEAINKALSLDPNLSEAYSAMCENKYYYEFDFVGAEAECKRAIVLDHNSSLAHEIYGRYLYHRGRFAEGINELKIAVDLEPTSLFNQRNLGLAFYYAGLYREAEAQFKRVIAMDENFASAYSWLRNVFELQRNYSEAFDWFMKHQAVLNTDDETVQLYRKLYQKHGYHAVLAEYADRFDKSINQYYVGAVMHAQVGNKEKAFEYLEIAYSRREWGINSLSIERRLDSLRGDSRFQELVRRVESK